MKEIQNSLDSLFLKAGQFNRYQFIMVSLFTLQYFCCQFFHVNFSHMTSKPIIYFNNTETRLDTDMCNKYFTGENPPYELVLSKEQIPTTSMILDFNLSCETSKIYFLDIIYYFGNIIGSCIAYHFYEKAGSKISLCIFTVMQFICFFLFQCLNISSIYNNIYFLYVNLFLLGFSHYIIVNLLFLYICDIINLKHIPLFITIIVSGRYLASLSGIAFFRYLKINWKNCMSMVGGLNVITFALILYYMVSSPKAALRNNNYMNFVRYLLKISKKNNKALKKNDFDFLVAFMGYKEKCEYEEFFHEFIDKNNIMNNKDDNKIDNDDEYKDLFIKSDPIKDLERRNTLKDEYLMSEENNKIGSIKTLFNETRMRDYSFFDFFKFQEHLINFSVVTFLWIVYNLIKSGLDFTLNVFPQYYNTVGWIILINVFGLITLFIIMLLYTVKQSAFHRILISVELLTFISLLFSLYLDDINININAYIASLVIAKLIWNFLYLLLILMSLLVYPIMLRSKGLGWNIALGIFGKLVATFVIDLNDKNVYVLYFLLFNFLMLIFSYSLPKRIGSIVIDLVKDGQSKKIFDKILKDDNDTDKDGNPKKVRNETISLMSIIN